VRERVEQARGCSSPKESGWVRRQGPVLRKSSPEVAALALRADAFGRWVLRRVRLSLGPPAGRKPGL
jgi:hypothetical protein